MPPGSKTPAFFSNHHMVSTYQIQLFCMHLSNTDLLNTYCVENTMSFFFFQLEEESFSFSWIPLEMSRDTLKEPSIYK